MVELARGRQSISVRKVAPGRYIAFLPGPDGVGQGRLRLVSGDHSTYTAQVVAALERAVAQESGAVARVMLVGSAQGGVTAAEVAAPSGPMPSSSTR